MGVLTTAQLHAAGLSSRQIRRLVRQGALRPLLTGVYASQAVPAADPAPATRSAPAAVTSAFAGRKARQAGEELLRVAAALAVTGSRSAVTGSGSAVTGSGSAGSHGSAARMYGLGVVAGPAGPLPPCVAFPRAQLGRDARLRAAGYEVVHFTWPEITRAPAQVVDAIQLAFSRGGRPAGP